MTPPRKYKGEVTTFTLRVDTKKWRAFSSIAALQGKSSTDILTCAVDDYITQHKDFLASHVIDEIYKDVTEPD